MGLLNSSQPQPAPPAAPPRGAPSAQGKPLSNALLEKEKQKIEAQLPPQLRTGYDQIVMAARAFLESPGNAQNVQNIMAAIEKRGNQPKDIAVAIINLISLIFKQSGGKMNPQATPPAVRTIMLLILDDLQHGAGLKITPQLLQQVATLTAQAFAKAFGSNPGATPPPAQAPASQPAQAQEA